MFQLVLTLHRSISLGSYGVKVRVKSEIVQDFPEKLPFWKKNNPVRENFQNFVPKGFITTQIQVLCANFVKSVQPEVGEIARCSPDKKNFGSRFCSNRAQNLPGPASNNVLRVTVKNSSVTTKHLYRHLISV